MTPRIRINSRWRASVPASRSPWAQLGMTLLAFSLFIPIASARVAVTSAANDRISIRAQAAAMRFGPDDDVEFLILFRNSSDSALRLPITEYLGAHTFGVYRFNIQSADSDRSYRVVLDPDAKLPTVEASLTTVTLQTNEIYVTRLKLPGPGRKFQSAASDATEGSGQIPPGRYDLRIDMALPTEKVTLGPIPFEISNKNPTTARAAPKPSAKVRAAADKFLEQRLALYKKANSGKSPWKELTVTSFASAIERDDDGDWMIEYLADFPEQRQKIRFEVVVNPDGKILTPNTGFTVISAQAGNRRR